MYQSLGKQKLMTSIMHGLKIQYHAYEGTCVDQGKTFSQTHSVFAVLYLALLKISEKQNKAKKFCPDNRLK